MHIMHKIFFTVQNFVNCGPQNQSRFNTFYILQLCIDNEVQPVSM